ncbi:MAG: HAD hydrolase-like protein [Oscillospiraceae bacterium]|jgi:phosphoglycolate phosphatase|nr:HAD hydrolase-like protein [Oscillospiraceae bacterium]
MKYSHIIWDFNGTLLDDMEAGIKSENVLLQRRNMPLIESEEQYRAAFCFPVIDFYKKLGYDFSRESYSELACEWTEQYIKFSADAKLFPYVPTILGMIQQTGARQIILSASEQTLLRGQVEKLGILEYFDTVLGLDNNHALDKTAIAKQWVAEEKPQKMLLIGDTSHDMEVAESIGADCLLIANGHQSYNYLKERGATLLGTICEVVNFLEIM